MSTDSLSPRQQPTLALVAAAAIEAAAAAATATAAAAQTKQFACTGCDLSFDRLEHLERHSRIHTGERPFACPFPGCDKTFSRRDNMSQHYRCHLHKGYRNQPREKREVLRKQFQSLGTALLPGNDGCRGGQPGSGPSSSSSSSSSSSPSSSSSSSAASSPAASRKLSRRRPPRLQAVPDDAAASMSSPLPSPASSPSSLLSSSSMEDLASRSRSNSCSLSPPQSLRDSFPPASEAPTNLATSFVPTLLTLPALNLPAPVLSQNMLVMSTVDTGMIGLLNQRLRIL